MVVLLAFAGIGCDDPCAELADSLRACCARGAAELRAGCDAEAARVERDGNAEACEEALDRGEYRACRAEVSE